MFVTKKKYEDAVYLANAWKHEYDRVSEKHNRLVARVNAKGGESFLKLAKIHPPPQPNPFTQEEIQKMLMLCHPDKHDGKQMAVEITQKLIKMRK